MAIESFSSISQEMLAEMAGRRSYERGEIYYRNNAVKNLRITGDRASATVAGTQKYKVHILAKEDAISATCTCPAYQNSGFCKHCVATGLAIMHSIRSDNDNEIYISEEDEIEIVRNYLKTKEIEELVEIIIDQAIENDHLMQTLSVKAESATEDGIAVAKIKGYIDEAVETCGFVEYYECLNYANGLNEVLEIVQNLFDRAPAEEVMELTEYYIEELEEALHHVDDSDGYVGDILRDLGDLHLEAAIKAAPDPVEFAHRLFELETNSEWDTYWDGARIYAPVLKEEGLAEYYKLVQKEWENIPALKAGQSEHRYDRYRRRITSIMEAIAVARGDVEELVAVKSRDLSVPYHYQDIAQIYHENGNHEKALEWALAGIEAFREAGKISFLFEKAAEQFQRLNRSGEALEMVWRVFSERPDLDNYKLLNKYSTKIKKWDTWREKALALIRDKIKRSKERNGRESWYYSYHNDHSALVEIFLWEKDPDSALAEANKGGCTQNLWKKLAAALEKTHPQKAISIYQQLIDPIVSATNKDAYREAAEIIKKIGALMKKWPAPRKKNKAEWRDNKEKGARQA